jgi:hypothetical protein
MGDPALFTFRDNGDFEFYDNVILHRGRHTIKAGAYFMHYNLRPVNPNGARGVFSFTPRWTSSAPGLADGNAFADFLLGYPTTAQVGLGRAALDANANWAHFYVQDNWQVTRTLKGGCGRPLRIQPEHDGLRQSFCGGGSIRGGGTVRYR